MCGGAPQKSMNEKNPGRKKGGGREKKVGGEEESERTRGALAIGIDRSVRRL
jgi:hypothetical protein